MKLRPKSAAALLLLALAPLLHLAACAGPGYYAQAISGHLRLMRQRQDVDALLADPATDPELAGRLRLAMEIRRFAVTRLLLPDEGGYLQFVETGREAVSWNVVAAPEFSLEPRRWCFPVAGCVPYRGYFERPDAERLAARLSAEGYDVSVSPAVAYSTLGWFDDPLLDTMLRQGEEQLAAGLIHELAHDRLYVRGDTAFSESYASFLEELGVELWLGSSDRAARLPDWHRQRQAAARFDALLKAARDDLAALYGSGAAAGTLRRDKAARLDALQAEYRALVRDDWGGRDYFGGWFTREVNNARLALLESYRGGICAFAALYREAGGDMARFHALAADRATLGREARRAWLQESCDDIASRVDL